MSNFPTEPVLNTLLTALGLLVFLGLGAFGVMSRGEKERRAVRIAASMAGYMVDADALCHHVLNRG